MKFFGFLFKADDKASKTAFFATIFSLMVVGLYIPVALGLANYPALTSELLMIFWGTYIGSTKAQQWIEAAKGQGAAPCPPPPPVQEPPVQESQPFAAPSGFTTQVIK